MKEIIKLSVGAKPSQSWAKGLELEKSILKNTSKVCLDFEKTVTEATKGANEALTAPIKAHVDPVYNKPYKSNQNEQEESLPEWVTLAKGQIDNDLAS